MTFNLAQARRALARNIALKNDCTHGEFDVRKSKKGLDPWVTVTCKQCGWQVQPPEKEWETI